MAWSPEGDGEWSRKVFVGPERRRSAPDSACSNDLFGSGLISNFDRSAFGLTSYVVNPSGRLKLKDAPRYTASQRAIFHRVPAPKGGFPQQAPDLFAIVNGLDDTSRLPTR